MRLQSYDGDAGPPALDMEALGPHLRDIFKSEQLLRWFRDIDANPAWRARGACNLCVTAPCNADVVVREGMCLGAASGAWCNSRSAAQNSGVRDAAGRRAPTWEGAHPKPRGFHTCRRLKKPGRDLDAGTVCE